MLPGEQLIFQFYTAICFCLIIVPQLQFKESWSFDNILRYIFERNSRMERIPVINPVVTETLDNELSESSIQIVLPLIKETGR